MIKEHLGSIKFLNQVSDYAYTLSRKSMNGEELNDTDFENLKKLYKYSVDLKNTLNEMALELNNGVLSWEDLNNSSKLAGANVDEVDVFASLESNFDDYEGLIYDGAYADFIVKNEKYGLTGDDIDARQAENKLKEIFGTDKVEKITKNSDLNGGDIDSFNFTIKLKDYSKNMEVEISKKGGWIIDIVKNRDVEEVKISEQDAIQKGKEFLDMIGYKNMKETYSLKQSNIVTINYAYEENEILMYPDLIKVKVALDDGEILGIESTGYLNAHRERKDLKAKVTSEEAKKSLNDKLEIENERMVVIPLDNTKEVFCYEFKGKIEDKEFLVYINANTGEEEEILVLLETEGGTLTI